MIKLTEQMKSYKPSMKLDFETGRSMEIDTMYWQPISEAKAKGMQMNAMRTIALQLEYLNEANPGQVRSWLLH